MRKVLYSAILSSMVMVANAQTTLTTGFDSPEWALGSANQNGFAAYGNSPVQGVIQSAVKKSGDQALQLKTLDSQTDMDNLGGVVNGYHTSYVAPVGETGTSASNGARVGDRMTASFWYQTPANDVLISNSYGGIVQMNPSFDTNRYAWIGVIDSAKDQGQQYWSNDKKIVLELDTYLDKTDENAFDYRGVTDLEYQTWYKIQYDVQLVDGLAGNGPNDVLTVSVFDEMGALKGSVTNSTWEAGFAGFFGPTGPHAINGMDFNKLTNTAGQSLGYVDDLRIASVPEPATMISLGLGALAIFRRRSKKA